MNNRVRMDGGESGRTNFGSSRRSHGCPPSLSVSLRRFEAPSHNGRMNTCAALRGDFWLLIAYDERRRDAIADRGWELRAALVSHGKQCRVIRVNGAGIKASDGFREMMYSGFE